MMGPAYFVMAILGCGEADTACQQVSVIDTHYESADACTAATAAAVERHSDLMFPIVAAQCRPGSGVLSDKIMPSQIDLPEPDRKARVIRASFKPQKPLRS